MVWLPFTKMFDDRVSRSCADLESAITEKVKAAPDCEAFVGVLIMPERPKSRFDANWSIRGVKFGRADRDKSNKVLANIVERMQREVRLSEDSSAAASKSATVSDLANCEQKERPKAVPL
jgi:hypothetical protein